MAEQLVKITTAGTISNQRNLENTWNSKGGLKISIDGDHLVIRKANIS